MQLLDATLAFVLTLAALATVVTVIMEACLRIARTRKKNLIEVMKLLNTELGKGALNMDEEERWEFFIRVVENPAEASIEKLTPELEKLNFDERLAYFGRDKAAGKGKIERIFGFIRQIFGDKKRASLYTTVSLEYMLRCLADSRPVKTASLTASETVKVEFSRIARKYEEFGSAVSGSFKHHAQAWSIAIGIALAIGANIDGLRIFEAYRVDPSLAAGVIEKQEEFIKRHQESQDSMAEFNKIQTALETAKMELKNAETAENRNETEINRKKQALAKAEAAMDKQVALKNIQMTAQRAQQQLADLVALGVPLGWAIYPNCPFGGTAEEWAVSSPKCKEIPVIKREIGNGHGWFGVRIGKTALNDPTGFILWFFIVLGTGVLVGLGAPFWFDVAKRLSQIRKGMQSASASAEYRLSASDANGNYEKRKEIVDNVLADAADEAAIAATGKSGRRRAFFDLKGGKHDRII